MVSLQTSDSTRFLSQSKIIEELRQVPPLLGDPGRGWDQTCVGAEPKWSGRLPALACAVIGEAVAYQGLRVGDHGVDGPASGIPPLNSPIQRAEDQHLRDVEVEFGTQRTRTRQAIDQLPPDLAVALFFENLALTYRLGYLTGIADRSRCVIRDLQCVSQVGFDGRQKSIQRRRLRRQRVEDVGYVHVHLGDPGPHHLFDEIFAGWKVVVDRRSLKVGFGGNVRQSQTAVALHAEYVSCRVEDAAPGQRRLRVALALGLAAGRARRCGDVSGPCHEQMVPSGCMHGRQAGYLRGWLLRLTCRSGCSPTGCAPRRVRLLAAASQGLQSGEI